MVTIREELVTTVYRSVEKGTTHVKIEITGAVPKGLVNKLQKAIEDCNKNMSDNDSYISHEIQTYRGRLP